MDTSGPFSFLKKLLGLREELKGGLPAAAAALKEQENGQSGGEGGSALAQEGQKFSKLALLRSILELDEEVGPKMESIHTPLNMLLYIYENILFKFESLHGLGVLKGESYENFNLIQRRCHELISDRSSGATSAGPDELAQENASLRRQLEALYNKHVKRDIISEGELRLEEEKEHFRARYEDVKKRYDLSKEKVEDLTVQVARLNQVSARYDLLKQNSARFERNDKILQDTLKINNDLEAKNRHLTSKLEYQERLIQAVAWSGPESKQLVESFEKLRNQKDEIDAESRRQSLEIAQTIDRMAPTPDISEEFNALLSENDALYNELREEDAKESLAQQTPENASIVFNLSSIFDESKRAGALLDAKRNILDSLGGEDVESKANRLLVALQDENRLLKQALEVKKERIKHLVNNPEHDILVKKNVDLRRIVVRMRHESDSMRHKLETLAEKCQRLESASMQFKRIARENLYYKRESEKMAILLDRYKKINDLCGEQKKTLVNMTMRMNMAVNECRDLKMKNATLESKVTAMRAEYSNLIDEYNKLFHDD